MAENLGQKFEQIASSIPGAKLSKMFGCPCIKASNGKASALIWNDSLVVKPPKEIVEDLLRSGYEMFAPMGGGKTMNGWVVIPIEHATKWQQFAEESYDYVSAMPKNK